MDRNLKIRVTFFKMQQQQGKLDPFFSVICELKLFYLQLDGQNEIPSEKSRNS